jgi:hypothetical protein
MSTSTTPPMGDMHPTEDQVMTKESLEKVSTLGKFLQSFLELVEDEKELHTLCSMIDHCAQGKAVPTERKVVNQLLRKKRTNREFRFNAQIGEYNIDNVILDLGSDVNVLPKKTWEMMGKPKLAWSPIQLRLENQYKIVPIGRLTGIPVNIDGVQCHRF